MGLNSEFEIAVVNEPSMFEQLKFYCMFHAILRTIDIRQSRIGSVWLEQNEANIANGYIK